MLRDLGKMAFKMLERNTSVFVEEDLKAHSLDVIDVTVFSGLCTELPSPTPPGNRQFCFIHFTVQVLHFSVSGVLQCNSEAAYPTSVF